MVNYLLLRDGVQQGPYSWPQLQEMLRQGAVLGTDAVRLEDSEAWTTLAALTESAGQATSEAAGAPSAAVVHAYARLDSEPLDGSPTYRLFDYRAVGAATIFGSPIVGTALIAINYYRLGLRKSAVKSIACGLAGIALAVTLSFQLGGGARTWITIGTIVLTSSLARMYQATHIAEHQRRGGKLASRWGAFFLGLGVGLVMGLVLAALTAVLMLMLDGPGS